MRPVWVEHSPAAEAWAGLVLADNRSTWRAVDAVGPDAWTWLAGPDGLAVMCTPPEVTRADD